MEEKRENGSADKKNRVKHEKPMIENLKTKEKKEEERRGDPADTHIRKQQKNENKKTVVIPEHVREHVCSNSLNYRSPDSEVLKCQYMSNVNMPDRLP
jgi:transposase